MEEIIQRLGFDNSRYLEAKEKLPAPDGQHCIICGKDLPKRKRLYCSHECWEGWYHKIDGRIAWQDVRWKAIVRDNHKCLKCGKDGGFVDHIKPIALGGAEFDLKNLQTLCEDCNREKTKKDLADISEVREKIKAARKQIAEIEKANSNKERWKDWQNSQPERFPCPAS